MRAFLAAAISVATICGCASTPPKPFDLASAPPRPCDPEYYAERPLPDQDRLAGAYQKEPRMTEIQIFMRAPADRVTARVLEGMLRCKMPVTQSTGGVLEADYGEHTGLMGLYAIKARAYVIPMGDTLTLVRFAGDEISKRGSVLNPTVSTDRISNRNAGTSGAAFRAMRNVAKQLLTETDLHPDWDRSTSLGLVFISKP